MDVHPIRIDKFIGFDPPPFGSKRRFFMENFNSSLWGLLR